MTILAFTDCETTHLSTVFGEVWEVAVILRDHNGAEDEHVWQFAPRRLDETHAEALRVGRYHERYVVPASHDAAFTGYPNGPVVPMTRPQAISAVTSVLRDAVIIGSNPGFDDRHLRKLLDIRDEQPWTYRPTCIANLAEGYLWATRPDLMADTLLRPHQLSSKWLSRQVGVEPPGEGVAHTALGDARWARDVYDAITRDPRRGGAS